MWDITVQFYNIVHFTDLTIALKQIIQVYRFFLVQKVFSN